MSPTAAPSTTTASPSADITGTTRAKFMSNCAIAFTTEVGDNTGKTEYAESNQFIYAAFLAVWSVRPTHHLPCLQPRKIAAPIRRSFILRETLRFQGQSDVGGQECRHGEHRQRTHRRLYGSHGHAILLQAAGADQSTAARRFDHRRSGRRFGPVLAGECESRRPFATRSRQAYIERPPPRSRRRCPGLQAGQSERQAHLAASISRPDPAPHSHLHALSLPRLLPARKPRVLRDRSTG